MATDKNKIVEGYALLFNTQYVVSNFMERIHPTALKNADYSDVRLLREHDARHLLARTTTGTLRLQIDGTGLFFRATLPSTTLGEETAALITRGDLSQMSWGFTVNPDKDVWTVTPGGVPLRTIMQVEQIWDVSPVTYPANPATRVWVSRSEARDGETPEIEDYSEILSYIQQKKQTAL